MSQASRWNLRILSQPFRIWDVSHKSEMRCFVSVVRQPEQVNSRSSAVSNVVKPETRKLKVQFWKAPIKGFALENPAGKGKNESINAQNHTSWFVQSNKIGYILTKTKNPKWFLVYNSSIAKKEGKNMKKVISLALSALQNEGRESPLSKKRVEKHN